MKTLVALIMALYFSTSVAFAGLGYGSAVSLPAATISQSETYRGLLSTDLAASITVRGAFSFGKAGTIVAIKTCAQVVPTGTVTLFITKNGATNLLSSASFDLTSIGSSNTLQSLPLTANQASLHLTATDVVTVQIDTGLLSTGRCPSLVLELQPD